MAFIREGVLYARYFTRVDTDDNAKQSCVDTCNTSSKTLLACGPISRNRLSAVMSSETERVMMYLLSYREFMATWLRRRIVLVERGIRLAET
jgi:hypothetical protein